MTEVTITTTKNTVEVIDNVNNVIEVNTGTINVAEVSVAGPQGQALSDGDKGDVTVASNGTSVTVNAGAIDNANIASNAAIDLTKLATGTFPTGLKINTDNILTGAVTTGKIATGTIINGDISLTAAIVGTKILPDFGSQTITTTGTVNTGLINASSATDQILNLNSSDNGAVYLALKRSGSRKAYLGYGGTDSTLSFVNEISDGDINISGNDGGSQINVLSFDVSENGKATFLGDIATTGRLQAGTAGGTDSIFNSNLRIENTFPTIYLNDSDTDNDFYIRNSNGTFNVHDVQASVNRFTINSSGTAAFSGDLELPDDAILKLGNSDDLQILHQSSNGNSIIKENGGGSLSIQTNGANITMYDSANGRAMAQFITDGACKLKHGATTRLLTSSTGISVTGNITVTGTVDGRDLATDGTKLDGIESNATADQTASDIKTLLNSDGLVDAQIDASAAIAGTKISPNFGSQNITTTGQLFSSYATLTAVNPTLTFSDSNNNPDYTINVNSGILKITDSTNSADRFVVNSDGHVDITGNLDVGAGVDITGDLTVSGTTTLAGATATTASSANGIRNITTSTSQPSGGSDGDLWFTYTA